MARAPILPSNKVDPTGLDRLERGAMLEFDRRMRVIRKAYVAALGRIPAEPVVNKRYVFRLDQALLSALFAEVDVMVDRVLLEGGERDLWFMRAYVSIAHRRGTAQAYTNIGQQSPAYKAGRDSLDALLRSPPYQRRVALVAARQFEEMKGLSGAVKADMGRVLADGIGRGKNPKAIANELASQAGVEIKRAHKIARTEIPMALRRARWDEKDAAAEDYGVVSKLMQISALSPTTRATHAARHARLFDTEEMRDWYSRDGNAIFCKCGQVEVLVNAKGEPLVPAIIDRARRNYQVMKEKDKGLWAKG